jgi:hypothetical protein
MTASIALTDHEAGRNYTVYCLLEDSMGQIDTTDSAFRYHISASQIVSIAFHVQRSRVSLTSTAAYLVLNSQELTRFSLRFLFPPPCRTKILV